MKKNALAFAAALLAITLSAFTVVSKEMKQKSQTDYYWFNPGVTTQSAGTVHLRTEGDEESIACPGNGNPCKDGYATSQVTPDGMGNLVASGSPALQIEKN